MRAAVMRSPGVHPGDVLNLPQGKGCVAGEFDLADVGGSPAVMWTRILTCWLAGVGSAFGGDARTIIAVLLHELPDVLQGPVEFVAWYRARRVELVPLTIWL